MLITQRLSGSVSTLPLSYPSHPFVVHEGGDVCGFGSSAPTSELLFAATHPEPLWRWVRCFGLVLLAVRCFMRQLRCRSLLSSHTARLSFYCISHCCVRIYLKPDLIAKGSDLNNAASHGVSAPGHALNQDFWGPLGGLILMNSGPTLISYELYCLRSWCTVSDISCYTLTAM